MAVVPAFSLFDYEVTCSMPVKVTIDGALDAIAHTFEVFCGAKGDAYDRAKDLCETAISLVVDWAGKIIADPNDIKAREAKIGRAHV